MARLIGLAVVVGLLALPAGAGRAPEAAFSERPAGTLVFAFGSNRLVAVDVATGRRTVRRISGVAACAPQMHVTGGHVIFAGIRRGRTVVFAAPVTLERRPTRLGTAHAYLPSATPGRVWLAGTDCDRAAMVGVREVTVGGRVTQESARRVPGSWLPAAVRGGLVVQRERTFAVWDPRTGRRGPRLALEAVIGARGDVVAGCAPRSGCTRIAIQDAATLRTVVPRLESEGEIDLGAAFSPDAAWVAAPVRAGRRWSVAIVDTATGRATVVPGSGAGHYPELSWAASSGWLFARTGPRRLIAYRPGLSRAVALAFRAPRGASSFVAG